MDSGYLMVSNINYFSGPLFSKIINSSMSSVGSLTAPAALDNELVSAFPVELYVL